MAAFFTVKVSVKDQQKFQEYAKQATETIKEFNGEPILRGQFSHVIAGNEDPHQFIALVKFPTESSLMKWYESDQYQAIIPLRDEAADVVISSYVIPDS